jgi:prophage regulatory protein
MNTLDQPVLGLSEIGQLLGVSRQRAHQLAERPGFPTPYATLEQGRVWRTTQFVRWAEKHGRQLGEVAA